MNSYYLYAILISAIYIFAHEFRLKQNRNAIRAIIPVLAAMGICIYLTAVSVANPGIFKPMWFEDFLLLDLFALTVLLLAWATRDVPLKNLSFYLATVALSSFLVLFASESLLRAYYGENPDMFRGVRIFERGYNSFIDTMLHQPAPGKEYTKRPGDENATLMPDGHYLPTPKKRAGEKRILWLGDSMVEGAQVPLDQRFTSLLEKSSGQPHYSLAVAGTSTDFARVVAENYFDIIKPDVVILGFFPTNDYKEFGQQYSCCNFASLFVPDGNNFKNNCPDNSHSPSYNIFIQPENILIHYAAQRTMLGKFLYLARYRIYKKIAETFFFKPNPFNSAPAPRQFRNKDAAHSFFIPTEKYVCSMIGDIDKYVTARKAVFAVVMIPYTLKNKKLYNEGSNLYPPLEYSKAFLKCMSRNNIPFFNLHDAIDEKRLVMGAEDTVFLFDIHLNEKGHKTAAELLLPFERKLLNMKSEAETNTPRN